MRDCTSSGVTKGVDRPQQSGVSVVAVGIAVRVAVGIRIGVFQLGVEVEIGVVVTSRRRCDDRRSRLFGLLRLFFAVFRRRGGARFGGVVFFDLLFDAEQRVH